MQTITFGSYELSRLMLGTVQFGLNYGVANANGQPTFQDVCAILERAVEGGVNCLDTAPAYGESESVVGRALSELGLHDKVHVVSKAMRFVDAALSSQEVNKAVETEVAGSLRRLQLDYLPICLVHSEANFRHIEALLRLKEKGWIRHVGCSISDLTKARGVLHSGQVEAIQIPINIVDRRLRGDSQNAPDFLDEAAASEVAIFARSAYLQGLLVMEPDEVPSDLREVVPVLQQLRAIAAENRLAIEEMVLRAVLAMPGVSCLVVGVESVSQVQRNLEILRHGTLSAEILEQIESSVPVLPDYVLNPFHWKKQAALAPPKD